MIAPARAVAFEILLAVHRGGYASDLLLSRAASLDSRDAGLAHQLVFGCLRYQAQLDYLIQHYSGRVQRLDPEVLMALRLGVYQLRYLERIPRHAAVSESVEMVKKARKRSATGLVNAVLRKVKRDPVEWPSREAALSCPAWLIAKWERQFGARNAETIALAALKEPEAYMRGDRIQDIGSQSIVPLLELQPNHTFLDLCAAPGNKTAQALESGAGVIACDISIKRLQSVTGCSRVALDAAQPLPFATQFDRILLDAPCSGTGTLGRNPEIKWRLAYANLSKLALLQCEMVRNGLRYLKPGGRLVYSTCSLENEENQDVVAAVTKVEPGVRVIDTAQRLPGIDAGDGFFAAVITLG